MKKKAAVPKKDSTPKTVILKYPRHSLEKVLRIPKAILDQNAGRECSDEDTVIRYEECLSYVGSEGVASRNGLQSPKREEKPRPELISLLAVANWALLFVSSM